MKPPGKDSGQDNWSDHEQPSHDPAGMKQEPTPSAEAQPNTGSVIDLVSARTRRTLRRSEGTQSSRGGAPLGRAGSGATSRFGAISGLRHGNSRKAAAPRPLGFKLARALQLAVIFAGTLYLLHTCGYL